MKKKKKDEIVYWEEWDGVRYPVYASQLKKGLTPFLFSIIFGALAIIGGLIYGILSKKFYPIPIGILIFGSTFILIAFIKPRFTRYYQLFIFPVVFSSIFFGIAYILYLSNNNESSDISVPVEKAKEVMSFEDWQNRRLVFWIISILVIGFIVSIIKRAANNSK